MKKTLSILLALVLGGSALVFAMDQAAESETYSWRYKMTVEVNTPEGVKTGSAVRAMGNNRNISFPVEARNPGEVTGEAVVVDLGERGVLFALIAHNSDLEFYGTFPTPNGGGSETAEGYKYYASLPVGTKASIGTERYIRLVTFKDMDDPKSVELVYDKEICSWAKEPKEECDGRKGLYTVANRFEELFGEGVGLKDITLEITDEPMTVGVVDKFLPWLKNIVSNIDGTKITSSNQLSNTLHSGNFKRK